MIKIAISVEAFDAIARTLPLGSVGYEAEPDAKGEMHIWIDDRQADRLAAMRGPGESFSLPLDAGKTKLPLGAG